jgi:hypothetical protein
MISFGMCEAPTNPLTLSKGRTSNRGAAALEKVFAMSLSPLTHYHRTFEVYWDTNLRELVHFIPLLSHADRKTLITIARARHFPDNSTTLHRLTWSALRRIFANNMDLLETLRTLVSSPMLSGFFLSACLSAPYSYQDVLDIKSAMMWKEVSVMESTPRHPSIDWTALNTIDTPLHPDMKPSPETNRRIRSSLRQWLHRCQSSVLYPSMGIKSVSFETRNELENSINAELPNECDVTSSMIEHYYSRSGILLGGGCEMKQRWYPTQASPRTYFAQGGQAYHSSKYLRDPFNWLCDSFHPTNRYSRVSPSGIPVNLLEEDVFIYDLTSFTSLFHEQRSFLEYLASITMEENVTIFDSFYGPTTTSLGSLINDYISNNLVSPSYTTRIGILTCLELHHSIAGFLGVFGNLATCTFPHGVCLSTVYDNPDQCWCAGDDAGTKEKLTTCGKDTYTTAKLLGVLAEEKVFRASESGAIALKRPIDVQHGMLYQHQNVLWPVFSILCDSDPRYNLPEERHTTDRITGALVSFLKSCQTIPLSPSDIEFAYQFFESFYRRFRLPMSGWYPPLTGYFPWKTTIPRMDRSVFGKDPLHVLIDSFFGTEYITSISEECPWDREIPHLNESFTCNSERHLTYLERLGYLSKEILTCVIPGVEGLKRARQDVDMPQEIRPLYQYTVVETVPEHLMVLSLEQIY